MNPLERIKHLFVSFINPIFMAVLGIPLMGFGAANLNGSWESIFRTSGAFFSLLTAFGGFVITLMGIVWWWRKLKRDYTEGRPQRRANRHIIDERTKRNP